MLNLDIWAFVRLMVNLEEQGGESPLFDAWAEPWAEVDAQLTELAESDFEAYSAMMMETHIELELDPALTAEFDATLGAVLKELEAKKAKAKDADFIKDLSFEIEGLRAVQAAGA